MRNIKLPFEYENLSGREAFGIVSGNNKNQNRSTIVLDDVEYLKQMLYYNKESVGDIINRASTMKAELILSYQTSLSEFYNKTNRSSHIKETLTQCSKEFDNNFGFKSSPEVTVGYIPTKNNFEIPAYLKFGGWNECPKPEEHVCIHRYWFNKYSSKIIFVSSHSMDCILEYPPDNADEALKLAHEQYMYCKDIIIQGSGSISSLAGKLLNNPHWHFFWD
jgi:hypothetical protein